MEGVYDPDLDRYDVAIRAVIRILQGRGRVKPEVIGLSRAKHFGRLDRALLEVDGSLRREDVLFAVCKRCPFLVDAAVELLKLYWDVTSPTLRWHYRREGRNALGL